MEALRGGRIFDGTRILEGSAVVLAEGRIRAVVAESGVPSGTPVVDLAGQLLAPGFIDIQVNGGAGVLFNDQPNPDGIGAIAAAHRRLGTTGLLPTLISDDWEVMTSAAEGIRTSVRQGEPGGVGGLEQGRNSLLTERGGVVKFMAPEPRAGGAQGSARGQRQAAIAEMQLRPRERGLQP